MRRFGELPSDLRKQDTTMGPPPAWFTTPYGTNTIDPNLYYSWQYSPQFYGLGDREAEIEVNPVEELRELKYRQQMNKKIPPVANRYTEINPISPIFRAKRRKFGYGGLNGLGDTTSSLAGLYRLAGLAVFVALVYHGYMRDESILYAAFWGILGGIFWPIALPVAFAQGFAKKAS